MEILQVENLTKKYTDFTLDNVSFSISKGYIMGFIGENGAGKTTTLKSILNIVKRDSGKILVFGKDIDEFEVEIKKDISFMTGELFYPKRKVVEITNVFKRFYSNFDEEIYQRYIDKFNINPEKKIDELSRGMNVKYQIALALSHHAKLIILDEPTSGLDPVARDQLLEIFQNIIEDGEVSILFSTHITSDLEKCADYITFIKDGKIISSTSKDELLETYLLVNGDIDFLEKIKSKLISYKNNAFGFTGLIRKEDFIENKELRTGKPNLEEIMIYYSEKRDK